MTVFCFNSHRSGRSAAISREWPQARRALVHWGIFIACLFSAQLPADAAKGAPWRVEGIELEAAQLELLQGRFASLDRKRDIATLIRELAQIVQAERIEALYDEATGMVTFSVVPAILITEVRLNLVTRTFRGDIEKITEKYLGQADSANARYRLLQDVRDLLARKGFPSAKVDMRSEKGSGGVGIDLTVDENLPCLIDDIRFSESSEYTAAVTLRKYDLCDFELIEDAQNELENIYQENGYYQAKVEKPEVIYNDSKSKATVSFVATKGTKVQYETVIADGEFNLRSFLFDDIINKDDANSIDPSAMIGELTKRYQNQGFSDVVVERPEVTRLEEDSFLYRFRVTLGPRYLITHIKFEGMTLHSEQEAAEIMGMKGLWQDASVLNPEMINEAIDKLRDDYMSEGYWDAKIRFPNVGKDRATGQATVTFRVQEGKRRRLGSFTVSGNAGVDAGEIRGLLPLEEGDVVNQNSLVAFEEDLKNLYINRGFVYADAALEITATERQSEIMIGIEVRIDEFKRTIIGNITIEGLRITRSDVVSRELLFRSGDWYDPESIAATGRGLRRLGIFRSVSIGPTDRSAMTNRVERLDLTVEVVEAEPGSISFGPGYSWPEGLQYTGELGYSNLFGQAKKVSMQASISEQRQQAAISSKTLFGRKFSTGYFHPYTLGTPIDTNVTLAHRAVVAEQNNALWQIFYSGEIDFQYRLRELMHDATISLFYGQMFNQEEGIDEDKIYLISTGDSRIGYIGSRFSIDKRNNIKWPSTGYTFDIEYELARYPLGGNIKYDKWELFLTKFFGITDASTALVGLNMGSYRRIAWEGDFPDVLPVSERFTAGGIGSVRGFNRGALGPYISHPNVNDEGLDEIGNTEKKVTGGSQKVIMKLEYRYRFWEDWAVTAFADSGTVFLSQEEINQMEDAFGDIHASRLPDDGGNEGLASVEENLDYRFTDFVTDPKGVWNKHFTAVGPAASWLLPIGSMNFACGFPVHIAKTNRCLGSRDYCIRRGAEDQPWYNRYTCGLHVGARF